MGREAKLLMIDRTLDLFTVRHLLLGEDNMLLLTKVLTFTPGVRAPRSRLPRAWVASVAATSISSLALKQTTSMAVARVKLTRLSSREQPMLKRSLTTTRKFLRPKPIRRKLLKFLLTIRRILADFTCRRPLRNQVQTKKM